MEECKRNGLNAGFASSVDVTGPGSCQNNWGRGLGKWHKSNKPASSIQIFDKVSPNRTTRTLERDLLLSHHSIQPFNNVNLYEIFFDKLKTYKTFTKYAIPTVSVKSSTDSVITKSMTTLKKRVDACQFPHDLPNTLVLKDRYGAGGNRIYKIKNNYVSNIKSLMIAHPKIKFILQPYLAFENGYNYKGNNKATDIRLIFNRNQIIQAYISMAKRNDFRCNLHQGGELKYISSSQIPESVKEVSRKLLAKINLNRSLFALDFTVSNHGNVYFIEGKSEPGITWVNKDFADEKMSKELINCIVQEFVNRLNNSVTFLP